MHSSRLTHKSSEFLCGKEIKKRIKCLRIKKNLIKPTYLSAIIQRGESANYLLIQPISNHCWLFSQVFGLC